MPAVSRHRLILLVIVLVGLAARFTYIAILVPNESSDGLEGQMAHNIVANGRWFYRTETDGAVVPEADESVGTSLIIAGVWTPTGSERYIAVAALQGIVDSLTALLVYWIAVQLFKRRRPALIAAALYAIYLPVAHQTATVYNDIWAIEFTVWILALYLVAIRSSHRWRWWLACGLCAGVGAYFRPQVLLLAPALCLATAFSTGWRETLRRAALVSLVGFLPLVPWTIRNYDDFHAFIPTRSALWMTVWGGLGEMANDFGGVFSQEALVDKVHRVRPDLVAESPAWDSYAKRYVVQTIEQHPFWYLELLAHRVAIATVWQHDPLWMHIEAGKWSHYKGSIVSFALSHPLDVLEDAVEPGVFLLAMLGLRLTWRRQRRQHAILLALVLSTLLPYIAVHVELRYLLPAVPAYMIWIGLGADLVIERVAGRSRRARSKLALRRVFGRTDLGLAPHDL